MVINALGELQMGRGKAEVEVGIDRKHFSEKVRFK